MLYAVIEMWIKDQMFIFIFISTNYKYVHLINMNKTQPNNYKLNAFWYINIFLNMKQKASGWSQTTTTEMMVGASPEWWWLVVMGMVVVGGDGGH